jgi:hypothetical protein
MCVSHCKNISDARYIDRERVSGVSIGMMLLAVRHLDGTGDVQDTICLYIAAYAGL